MVQMGHQRVMVKQRHGQTLKRLLSKYIYKQILEKNKYK